MTITIADGRGALWQWDTGRRVKITDGDGVKQVHYQNKCFGRSVDVDVGDDGTAIIPDELLQDYHTLTAYAYVTDDAGGYTKVQQDFAVYKRAKPADYVYTPTERAGFDKLRAEIGELSALQTNAKNNLVSAINEAAASESMDITGATVGQIAKIAAVDASGVPTAWSPVDMPSGSVQPDWNQNDETRPDYVKNRPFYTGEPVETVLVEESTVTFADADDFYLGSLESTFSAAVGETYKVSWDGTIYECTCVEYRGIPVFGNLSIVGVGSDTGEPFMMAVNNDSVLVIYTADTSASHTLSISRLASEVVKIDEKYLPDIIATKSEVEVAQNMANSNKEVLYSAFSSAVTFTFDKQTSGRDTFVFNAFHYYKISDFNPAPENVISFNGTAENGDKQSKITTGNNCVEYGFFIVVASAGRCSLPVTDTDTFSFDATSAGLYAMYFEGDTSITAGTGQFTLMQMDGLTIKSSTANSTKKFRITVDDSGTLTATEVTK